MKNSKVTMKYGKLWSMAVLTTACVIAPAQSAEAPATPPASTPATANPALEKFGNAITFYAGFGQSAADLSGGVAAPRDPKLEIETQPGLWGQAFLSTQRIAYNAAQNVDLSKPGALAVWVSPYDWERVEGTEVPYISFASVQDQGRLLLLARMGKTVNKEAVYAYGKAGDIGKVVKGGASLNWKNGEWHLLVANWRNASIEFSLDGGALRREDLPQFEKAQGKPGQLFVGGKSGPRHQYLVDELMIFDRPLEADEIKWMWEMKPQTTE